MVIAGREVKDYLDQEKYAFQKTVQKEGVVHGIGVHSGAPVSVRFRPASPDSGLSFFRTDAPFDQKKLTARWDNVKDTRLSTQLANASGATLSMVEHLMAALAGLEIDNLDIEVDGPEMPVLDGSSQIYVETLQACGAQIQNLHRRAIKILAPVEVREGDRFVRLSPAQHRSFDFSIDFFGGREGMTPQHFSFDWTPGGFLREIARARTFGFFSDAQKLQEMGLAHGASLDNTLVLQEGRILNEGGERLQQECVRHKILDAVGDLALAGAPIIGAYTSHNGGHEMNNKLLHALFADATLWCMCQAPQEPLESWQPFSNSVGI